MSLLGWARDGAILALAGGAFLFEVWTVVPAPNLPIAAVAVMVPEVAPVAALVCGAIVAVAFAWSRGPLRTVALVAGGGALGCALLPLLALPGTLAAANRELEAIGAVRGENGPLFDVATFLRGYPAATNVRVERDLAVVTPDGARLALDLYRPAKPGPHPALVVIYGGAWQYGSREDSEDSARAFAASGYAVAAIEYRLAPKYRFPTELDDVRAALAALAHHARAWQIDPTRVAIFGSSAGAELALLAAYEPGPLKIRAVVGYYSPADLTGGYLEPPRPDPANVRAILEAYLGGTPQSVPAAYRAASPLAHVRAGLPPTLLVSGARDELVPLRFQRALRDALRAHDVPVAAIELPWSNHAFDSISQGLGGQIARSATRRFLAAELRGRR